MQIRTDIVQGTPEWHEVRYGKIGGSSAKRLFVKTNLLEMDLLACASEPYQEDEEEGYQSADMIRGTELEPEARKEAIKYTGIQFNEVGWIQSAISLLGISPDGISDDLKSMLEIKCPGARNHLMAVLANEIPDEHIDQCVHNFTVNPHLETLYFVSYRPEAIKPFFIKEMTKDTMINTGTKAKPVMRTVKSVAEDARQIAMDLESNITNHLINLRNDL